MNEEQEIVAYCQRCGRKFLWIADDVITDRFGYPCGKSAHSYSICGGVIVRIQKDGPRSVPVIAGASDRSGSTMKRRKS